MPKGVSEPREGSFKPKKSRIGALDGGWTVNHDSLKLHWRGPGQCYRTPGLAYENFSPFRLASPPKFGIDFKSLCQD